MRSRFSLPRASQRREEQIKPINIKKNKSAIRIMNRSLSPYSDRPSNSYARFLSWSLLIPVLARIARLDFRAGGPCSISVEAVRASPEPSVAVPSECIWFKQSINRAPGCQLPGGREQARHESCIKHGSVSRREALIDKDFEETVTFYLCLRLV